MESTKGTIKITPTVVAHYIYDQAFGDDEYYRVRVGNGGRGHEAWCSMMGWPSDETLAEILKDLNWITITDEQIKSWLKSDNSFWGKKNGN